MNKGCCCSHRGSTTEQGTCFGASAIFSSRLTCLPFQPPYIQLSTSFPRPHYLPRLRNCVHHFRFGARRGNPPCMLHPARPTFITTLYPLRVPHPIASLDILSADSTCHSRLRSSTYFAPPCTALDFLLLHHHNLHPNTTIHSLCRDTCAPAYGGP